MDQDLDAKVVLPELFAYEKDQTVKANQVLLAMGSEEGKKLDPADKIEEKEEDGTKFLLFHFKAGQDEIKLALKGVKNSRLFTDLPRMKKGDVFYIHNLSQVLAYKVYKIEVIKPSQIEKDKDLATLLTCTPYMINTHRLLVTGHRIPYHPKEAKKEEQNGQMKAWLKLALIILAFLALIALFIWWTKHRRGKKGKGQANQDDVKENKEN